MESLFAVPMRNNNDNLLDSGPVLLSDWVTVADIGGVHLRIDCTSIDTEVIITYAMFNNSVRTGSGGTSFDTVGKHEIVFSRTDFNNTTTIQGTVQTVGSARFSLEVLSSEKGEDIIEWL